MLNRSSTNNDSFISFLVLNTLAGTSNTMFSNDNESKCLSCSLTLYPMFSSQYFFVLIMYIYYQIRKIMTNVFLGNVYLGSFFSLPSYGPANLKFLLLG